MQSSFLETKLAQIEPRYSHLLNLLTDEEKNILEGDLPTQETPIWKHWQHYVVKTLILGKSPITIKSVRDTLNIIIRHTGLFTVEQINEPGILDNALLELQIKRQQKPSTRNTYIKNINTYFIWLYKNHLINKNNIARIEKGRESSPEIAPLTFEQIEKTVAHISSRHHASQLERVRNILMIDIFRFSGIRPCELLQMETDHIFCDDGQWRMKINGRKQKGRIRYYEIPSFVRYSYQHYLHLRDKLNRWEDPLFISMSSREGWKMSGMMALFKKISKELGFRVTAYGFRRFVASQLSRSNIQRDDLSRYLGHTRFTTTDRYIERSCHLTRNAGAAIGKLYGEKH